MADSEKKDSLLKEAKAKTSMLDDDFSKDFLSSWKSMSATGGDDMDFDFEPVSKGKKKKFDFGMDMDFSLDDAFGKISSFKIDMPDFDFSSSPKEPTKPKEKTDEDSGKGKNQDTNDNFFFSFDFDGGPTAENTTLTKNKIPGDINSKCPVAQDTIDSGRTELSTSEDKGESSTHIVAADKSISFSCSYGSSKHNEKNSDDYPSSCTKELIKSSILGEREKIATAHIDAADAEGNRQNEKKSDDRVSSCTKELIKADSILETSEKIAAARTSLRVRDDTEFEENRNEMNADTVSLPHHGKETNNRLPSLKNEKIITNVKSARDADLSLDDAFGKMSTFKLDLPDVDLPTSPGKHTKPKEKSEEDSGKGNTHGMSSLDFDGEPTPATRNKVMEAMNSKFRIAQATTDNGRPELSVSEGNGEGLTHLDAVDKSCSKYGSSKHNENDLDEDYPSSSTKELSKPDSVLEESEKIAAARIDDVDRSYGGIRHNEKYSDEFTNSCTKELTQPDSVLEEREKIAAAGIDGVDRSSYGDSSHQNKSDDTTSSCIKELIKPDSVLEKSEKIAAAHTPPRDHDGSVYEKQRNEMSVDTALHSIKEAKSGLPSLEHKKMINNVKSSGFKVPSVSPREQGSQLGNQVRFSVICSSYGDSRHTENKSDDTTSSCIKELIKPDSVLEKSEKIAAAHTPPRDHDGSVYEKQRNEMSVDTALHSVKEAKSGLPSLEHKKMINDVKSSGFKVPSVSPREQGSQLGNQVQGKFNNKISGTGLIPKLNICHGNKAPSQSIVKKTLSLPSLTVTRGATKDKHPAAPPMQRIAKSPGNVEKSTKLQATIKMVLPVSAEKQTPSTPSLKRKPSEVVDMVPAKLHTPKRVLTGERRMSNIAVREVEEGAQTQGNFVERNRKNDSVDYPSPKFDFSQEASREALQFNMVVENDENVEKAEACAKELDNICNMLKKKHEEAKELLVRALVNNNNLLMLNHPLYEEKIRAVQRLASRLMSRELEVEA